MVDPFGLLARRHRFALVPDGQHLAVSKLQGDSPHRPALAAHCYPVWRAHLFDLELFATRVAGAGHSVCQHRYRDSRGGHYPAQVPPSTPIDASGASNWIRRTELKMPHAHRSGPRSSIAIVGGETLLGKEVHELLEARRIPADIQLVASFEALDPGAPDKSAKAASILAIGKEEPLVMSSIEAAELG